MAISNLAQFGLLLWKNWLLQKRRIFTAAFQIISPAVFGILLLLIRLSVDSKLVSNATTWESFQASTFPNLTLPRNPDSETSLRDNMMFSDNQTLLNNLTLPPHLTAMGNSKWWLVFSPNTLKAANRIATKVAQRLDMMPLGRSLLYIDLVMISVRENVVSHSKKPKKSRFFGF